MQSTATLPVIGLDLAKSVFQLHIVEVETGEIQRRRIKSTRLTEFFAKCEPSLVAMEACGSATTAACASSTAATLPARR
jgi:transposase